MKPRIPFNKPYMTGKELWYISQAHHNGQLSGDGPFTKRCHAFLENKLKCQKVLLTHSCTVALEMTALLLNIQPGDEIIMPSYTFVSTANAFVLRGGVPVFIDIDPTTLNIDVNLIEPAITTRTRAIVPVHYAGVSCEMDSILKIAQKYKLAVVEDAAQGHGSLYNGKPLGTIGDFGTLSFHETKNIISGEGGALLINKSKYTERAEIIREKGTNRSQFFRGQVDKYSWVDIGSSCLPGEVIAAFLLAQLEEMDLILEKRKRIWNNYHNALENLEQKRIFVRPKQATDKQNAHMYYIIMNSREKRDSLMDYLASQNISSVFHYIPLHSSSAGKKYGREGSIMKETNRISDCLLRLPLFANMEEKDIDRVVSGVEKWAE